MDDCIRGGCSDDVYRDLIPETYEQNDNWMRLVSFLEILLIMELSLVIMMSCLKWHVVFFLSFLPLSAPVRCSRRKSGKYFFFFEDQNWTELAWHDTEGFPSVGWVGAKNSPIQFFNYTIESHESSLMSKSSLLHISIRSSLQSLKFFIMYDVSRLLTNKAVGRDWMIVVFAEHYDPEKDDDEDDNKVNFRSKIANESH